LTGTWASGWATGDIVTAAEFKKSAGAIFDSTLGASAASIDVTGISNTYAHLMISIYSRGDTAAISTDVMMRFNGDTAANYDWQRAMGIAAATSAFETFAQTTMAVGFCPGSTAGANLFASQEVFIPNYAGSTNNKQHVSIHSMKAGTASTNLSVGIWGGSWRSNAAINQVTLLPQAGNFVAGTRVTVHALGA
jgi:hypothetical protein